MFIKLNFVVLISILLFANTSCNAQNNNERIGGPCEGCEEIYVGMPKDLSWQYNIADKNEPGEKMEISGIIYKPDGKTPAPGIILYVYHTDNNGLYSPSKVANGYKGRHGHLRGWIKTNNKGEYKFTSIKPAPYPNSQAEAHIHPIIKEPDKNEYYIDEYVFEDDPNVNERYKSRVSNLGGSGIIKLTKNSEGVWIGRRDITLGLNVSGYK